MVLVAGIVFLACLVAGLTVVALAGLSLWRTVKRRGGDVARHMELVTVGADRASAGAARLEHRRGQLEDAGGELAARAQAAAVLGQAAATGAVLILAPIRFIMGR